MTGTLSLPPEPPVSSVVTPVSETDGRMWRCIDDNTWTQIDPESGDRLNTSLSTWGGLLAQVYPMWVRVVPDPAGLVSEPRTWVLPEEPPVGTVVGPVDETDQRRWRRVSQGWFLFQGSSGQPMSGAEALWSWPGVMRTADLAVSEHTDPVDPDGYQQQELDKLRAEVERLRGQLEDAHTNLLEAERDRDANAESLSRAQRERGEALREAAALRAALESLAAAASRAVQPS